MLWPDISSQSSLRLSLTAAGSSSAPPPAMSMARLSIEPARLMSSESHLLPGKLRVTEMFFQVPLDYERPSAGSISLFARCATKHETPIVPPAEDPSQDQKPYMVYLEGGPGFGNREPQDHPLTKHAVARGYQLLMLDHRGTGLSTPVSAEMLRRLDPTVDGQARYLRLMRQDNTVRDCEAVRKCLTHGWPEHRARWSTFGQSYGGFVTLTYLSMHPEGLRESFLTGGLAPVWRNADQVYAATFDRVAERNRQYFQKFPQDVETIRNIAAHIEGAGGIALPGGGTLTTQRLLIIGSAFGGHGGFDSVHSILLHLKTSLDQFGYLSRASLTPFETSTPFDNNLIYAILHEAIYCDGPGYASRWAAQRVGQDREAFSWLNPGTSVSSSAEPVYFSGEMIFPSHFDTYPELVPLKEVAEKLALYDDWPALYDKAQLSKNEVPVYAASYIDDMYVDYEFARETASLVRGIKTFETNMMYHSALRIKTDDVLQNLFGLRDDVMD